MADLNWVQITEADLLTKISGAELQGYRAAALAVGQVDPVAPAIAHVVNVVRGYVAACYKNKLSTGPTIPRQLMGAALDLLVPDIMMRAAGKIIDPKGTRAQAKTDALTLMRDVAACRFVINLPEEISNEPLAIPQPSFKGRTRQFTRETMDGL